MTCGRFPVDEMKPTGFVLLMFRGTFSEHMAEPTWRSICIYFTASHFGGKSHAVNTLQKPLRFAWDNTLSVKDRNKDRLKTDWFSVIESYHLLVRLTYNCVGFTNLCMNLLVPPPIAWVPTRGTWTSPPAAMCYLLLVANPLPLASGERQCPTILVLIFFTQQKTDQMHVEGLVEKMQSRP